MNLIEVADFRPPTSDGYKPCHFGWKYQNWFDGFTPQGRPCLTLNTTSMQKSVSLPAEGGNPRTVTVGQRTVHPSNDNKLIDYTEFEGKKARLVLILYVYIEEKKKSSPTRPTKLSSVFLIKKHFFTSTCSSLYTIFALLFVTCLSLDLRRKIVNVIPLFAPCEPYTPPSIYLSCFPR